MAKKKKVEEVYTLTFKGLLVTLLGHNEKLAEDVSDGMELHLRRHFSNVNEYPAIILTDSGFVMTTVEKG